jgi:hypothetical protein
VEATAAKGRLGAERKAAAVDSDLPVHSLAGIGVMQTVFFAAMLHDGTGVSSPPQYSGRSA